MQWSLVWRERRITRGQGLLIVVKGALSDCLAWDAAQQKRPGVAVAWHWHWHWHIDQRLRPQEPHKGLSCVLERPLNGWPDLFQGARLRRAWCVSTWALNLPSAAPPKAHSCFCSSSKVVRRGCASVWPPRPVSLGLVWLACITHDPWRWSLKEFASCRPVIPPNVGMLPLGHVLIQHVQATGDPTTMFPAPLSPCRGREKLSRHKYHFCTWPRGGSGTGIITRCRWAWDNRD